MAKKEDKPYALIALTEQNVRDLEELLDFAEQGRFLFKAKRTERGVVDRLTEWMDKLPPWWLPSRRSNLEACGLCKVGWDEQGEGNSRLINLIAFILDDMPSAAKDDIAEKKDMEFDKHIIHVPNSRAVWVDIASEAGHLRKLIAERAE